MARDAHAAADLDLTPVAGFLTERGVIARGAELHWRLLSGGRSNLTYLLDVEGTGYVVRRPPLGHSGAGAHDVAREFGILSALHPAGVPVPEPIALCEDSRVLGGAPFYVMRRVAGRVIESSKTVPDLLTPEKLNELIDVVVDGLVALHRVDYHAAGLGQLGKPAGYALRQVKRWTDFWTTRQHRSIPALDAVGLRLLAAASTGLPLDGEPATIVHGDYNIGNLMIAGSGSEPVRLAAILDWEMATLGHPLMDLGLLLTYNGPCMTTIFEVNDAIAAQPGFAPPAEIAARYAARSGRSVELLDFFQALAFFKVLVLIEDVRARQMAGRPREPGASCLGDSTPANAEVLLQQVKASTLPGLGGPET